MRTDRAFDLTETSPLQFLVNWRKSVVLKKVWRYANVPVRVVVRAVATPSDYRERPPLLVNSIPKSGTHLLIQILETVPWVRDWGLFLATKPSFTFREQEPASLARRVQGVAPGEIVGAHLHYDASIDAAAKAVKAAAFFIFRDPRDVAISEAHYLAHMNRWHKLHPFFRDLPDDESRIEYAIKGIKGQGGGDTFPDLGARLRKYIGWLDAEDVILLKYEDLVGHERFKTLLHIGRSLDARVRGGLDVANWARMAEENIAPSRSHTFRKGGTGGWREILTDAHREMCKKYCGDILVDLGYEHDLQW